MPSSRRVISPPGVQLCIAVIVVSGAIGMVLAPVLRSASKPVDLAGTVSRALPPPARVSTRTPEGTTNLIVPDAEVTNKGVTWVRTELATLPNGTPWDRLDS
jgi:hypothetical protein